MRPRWLGGPARNGGAAARGLDVAAAVDAVALDDLREAGKRPGRPGGKPWAVEAAYSVIEAGFAGCVVEPAGALSRRQLRRIGRDLAEHGAAVLEAVAGSVRVLRAERVTVVEVGNRSGDDLKLLLDGKALNVANVAVVRWSGCTGPFSPPLSRLRVRELAALEAEVLSAPASARVANVDSGVVGSTAEEDTRDAIGKARGGLVLLEGLSGAGTDQAGRAPGVILSRPEPAESAVKAWREAVGDAWRALGVFEVLADSGSTGQAALARRRAWRETRLQPRLDELAEALADLGVSVQLGGDVDGPGDVRSRAVAASTLAGEPLNLSADEALRLAGVSR